VTDSGIGISQDQQKKLFASFAQADASTSRQFGGTGLGLTISKRLAQLMGGSIGVESEPDKGSCFWFTISFRPATDEFCANWRSAQSGKAAASAPLIEELPEVLRGKRVLVAEDNVVNQMVVKGMLGKLNVQFEVVNDGVMVVEKYRDCHASIDLILMDCEMPNQDGFDATRAIRAFERQQQLPPVPVVALTAHVMLEHQQKAAESGMNAHLAKPLDLDRLRETLLRLLA
jgi:CheY-like chemotaxis protein